MGRLVDKPKVALIGRPNVGKSTLYNRLVGKRQAIVDELPGVTRDRLYGLCEWNGYEFTVIDSGGIGPESEDVLRLEVADNSRKAIAEADAIILVVDGRAGVTLSDEAVVKELRRQKRPVIVAVNKIDHPNHEAEAYAFYSLGYPDLYFVSALSAQRVGALLDAVVEAIDWSKWPRATPAYAGWRYASPGELDPEKVPEDVRDEVRTAVARTMERDSDDGAARGRSAAVVEHEEELPEDLELDYPFAWAADATQPRFVPDESWRNEPVRLVFVGRQNVGKSSLTNALLKEHRALVADLPGTTRDPVLATFEHGGQQFEVMDTAGMKRVTRLKEDVDYYSLIRAEKTLRSGEVALLVLDAEVGVNEQDRRVASKIAEAGRAIVIVVNKRDLLPEGKEAEEMYSRYVHNELGKLPWADVIYTSAINSKGLGRMLGAAERARENFHRRIDNRALRSVLTEAITLSPPPIVKNRELRFYDFRQIGNCPPAFLIEVNDRILMRQAYRRFIENNIRKHFDFTGTHIALVWYEKRRRGKR